MPARVVLLGATGYTGRLTAEALIGRGVRPLLVGRSPALLEALASELGGDRVDVDVANVTDPTSVRRLLSEGDVLITTVGPFQRLGAPAVEAAIAQGAHYLDSTGEPGFVRRVFESWGPRAQGRSALLTAFGMDWVPGNLAGALALAEAGAEARRLAVGYFLTGSGFGMSGGTRASAAGILLEPHHRFSGGRLQPERGAARLREFDVDGRRRAGVSVGGSEAYTLPRLAPALESVDTYLGWFGALSRPFQVASLGASLLSRVPGGSTAAAAGAARLVRGSSGGPDRAARARNGAAVVAEAADGAGRVLATIRLEGVNAYEFTGNILAAGAAALIAGEARGSGALGPADAFGVERLTELCADAGLRRVGG